MNRRFLYVLGIGALCYLVLQGLSRIVSSLSSVFASFNYWIRWQLLPHTWQIAIALGLLYLLYTAVFGRGRRF